jgi:hypothetical protein
MPLWLVKTLIGLAFFPALVVGVALLFLAATWMQVKEAENGHANAEAH